MISRKFTNEEMYGVDDNQYASFFEDKELDAFKSRYIADISLLEKQLLNVTDHYHGRIKLNVLSGFSMSDIENLIEIIREKIVSNKKNLERYTNIKLKKDNKNA